MIKLADTESQDGGMTEQNQDRAGGVGSYQIGPLEWSLCSDITQPVKAEKL